MPILANHVARYLRDLQPERTGVMREIEQVALREGIPRVPWDTGRFLATLVKALDPLQVLEIGTGFGYSTLHMAEALGRGRIVTIERDPGRAGQARDFFDRAGVGERVEVVEADGLAVIEDLDGPFDMIFLDGVRIELREYLRLAGPKLTANAVALVTGVLIWGLIAREYEEDAFWDPEPQVIVISTARALNAELVSSDRWLGVVLPVGGGLAFAVRR
jgi:predicted O-methyltransferase YrrM